MAQLRYVFQATTGNIAQNGPNWNPAKELRFLNWVWVFYAPKDEVEGSPTFGQVLPRNAANEELAVKAFFNAKIDGVIAQIRRYEKQLADAANVPGNMD